MTSSKYNNIAIIGLGTLGGFVSQSISELDFVKKLILIDFDIVENHNVNNSIYRKSDINKYKTTALHDIIKEQGGDIDIDIITEKYKESEFILPQVDLIIDCRDYICDRANEIDIKLFISSRYLIMDCRKNIFYDKDYDGRYLSRLTKNDLRRCSLMTASFLQNGFMDYMIKNQIIKEMDIDYIDQISNDIKNNYQSRNMIVDESSKKLLNLENNIGRILSENKNKDLVISVGDRKSSPLSRVIKKNSLINPECVVNTMTNMVNTEKTSQFYYIVSVTEEKNITHIELLPEVGAA